MDQAATHFGKLDALIVVAGKIAFEDPSPRAIPKPGSACMPLECHDRAEH